MNGSQLGEEAEEEPVWGSCPETGAGRRAGAAAGVEKGG